MAINQTMTSGADNYVAAANDSYDLNFLGGNDRLTVRAGTVTARLGAGDDSVRVEAGTATLYGEAGNDRFDLLGGTAHVNGGADADHFYIRGGTAHILGGGAGNDRFSLLGATSNIRLFGGDGDDYFVSSGLAVSGRAYGDAGNDQFIGFRGAAMTLHGGTGNDIYRADPTAPAAIAELAGEGIDTVQVAVGASYTLGANLEYLRVVAFATVAGAAELTGNALANRIMGSNSAETMRGVGGNDTLFGYGGADTLDGGAGNDRITGGLGFDTMTGGAGSDTFIYTSAADAPNDAFNNNWEFIADWESADFIDLSGVDANSTVAGHQHFVFGGESWGTPVTDPHAGHVYLAGFGGELYILGFTDADNQADFLISLWSFLGEGALTVDNLIL